MCLIELEREFPLSAAVELGYSLPELQSSLVFGRKDQPVQRTFLGGHLLLTEHLVAKPSELPLILAREEPADVPACAVRKLLP
jgi:hypothetical protein